MKDMKGILGRWILRELSQFRCIGSLSLLSELSQTRVLVCCHSYTRSRETRRCTIGACLADTGSMRLFKSASAQLRSQEIGAEEFYVTCQSLFGDRLDDVLLDLIALLPDINLQQQLAFAHRRANPQVRAADLICVHYAVYFAMLG